MALFRSIRTEVPETVSLLMVTSIAGSRPYVVNCQ